MRLGPLLIIFLAVMAIYVFPQVLATLAGSHTMEFNATGTGSLECVKCHSYIFAELNATDDSRSVLQVHRNAAGNESYTRGWIAQNITNTTDSGVCLLCHLGQVQNSHTKVFVRTCIDLDCHGTNESTNNTAYRVGSIGPDLGSKTNVHERWFDSMSGYDSAYQNETGINYTKGYWACLGCHTYVRVNINATEEKYSHDNANAKQRRYL